MPWYDIIWNPEASGNVEHIAEHGIAMDEVEEVICNPLETTTSHRSGLPVAIGYTSAGRLLLVVYEQIDETTVYPVTAYELQD